MVLKLKKKTKESQKLDITTGGEAIPKSETEEQGGGRLKIMTTNQLLTRLPILLAQKQADNNSQKMNNEIRQIIYSLYRSKNLSKIVKQMTPIDLNFILQRK